MKLIQIKKSTRNDKKFMAIFKNGDKTFVRHFGAKGYSDYTIHKDDDRKKRYIQRHKNNEDWSDPTKPGTLSRYILWEKKTLKEAINFYKKKFNI